MEKIKQKNKTQELSKRRLIQPSYSSVAKKNGSIQLTVSTF